MSIIVDVIYCPLCALLQLLQDIHWRISHNLYSIHNQFWVNHHLSVLLLRLDSKSSKVCIWCILNSQCEVGKSSKTLFSRLLLWGVIKWLWAFLFESESGSKVFTIPLSMIQMQALLLWHSFLLQLLTRIFLWLFVHSLVLLLLWHWQMRQELMY